jgi:elongation factor Ts
MQIAAMRPQYVTRDEVPADVVAKEREIAEATAREEGKPEQALAKITEGRVNGFFKDVVLLEQPRCTGHKKTVKAVLDEAGVTVTRSRASRSARPDPACQGLDSDRRGPDRRTKGSGA